MLVDVNIHNIEALKFIKHVWVREDGSKYYSLDIKVDGDDKVEITMFSDAELNLTDVFHEDPHSVG